MFWDGDRDPQFAASPRSYLHTRNQRDSWSPQQQLLGVFLVLPGILGSSGRHRCGWNCGMGLADFRDAPWSCSQGRTLCLGSASSSSLVHSPADPSLWELCGSSRQDPLVLRDSHSLPWQLHWLPDPSWGIPALHWRSELGTGDREQPGHRDTRTIPGWGQGAACTQGHQSHPGLGTGDRDQPGSAGWAFPDPSQWIKGLGASSCSGVSRPCRQEGLDGAGVALKWGSDLSLSVFLDPSCVILEKQEFPLPHLLCRKSGGEHSLPGSAGARRALGWARGDGNLQWA